MPKFIKFLLVSVLLVGLLHTGVQACWNGFEHDKTNYRCWLFQPDLMPASVVRVLSYADFESDYDDYMSKSKSFRSRGNADTSFYVQNIEEWEIALAADPSVKSAKTVVPKDIHTVLYNLDPDVFFRKMDGDSLRNNTFIQAISPSKSLKNYLNFAKICEQLMNFTDPWAEGYGEGKDEISLLRYSKMGDSVVKNKATSPFVRERTAYQMVKMAHYLGDTARVLALYKQFFAETASKSWVVGSASYYYAVARSDPFEQNYLLSKTFENSIDKRWLSLRNFDQSDSILRGSLALTRNVHERVTMLTLPILTNEGRTLPDLEKVYALEPNNPLLSMAIQREINKLEDWIYTNKFTEFSSSSKKTEDSEEDYYYRESAKQKDIDAKNLRSDLVYLNEITAFVTRVATEGKRTDLAFCHLAAGHLAFLKKDFKTAKQFLATAKTAKNSGNTPLSIQTQIWLTDLLCDLYAAEHLDANAETAILKFDDFLKKQKNTLADYTSFRSQIMRFISQRFISDGKMAKGALILSKSTLVFGTINDHWGKNCYHKLLYEGTPQDIEEVIDIVSRKERNTLTPFERWLASEPKSYGDPDGCRWCHYDPTYKPPIQKWDIDKLKDYESMIYVNQDDLENAYNVLKTVPEKFWQGHPYQEYMTENPFTPALDYRARSSAIYGDGDNYWENRRFPMAKYTKATFLKRLIELKQELASDPEKYEKNYFIIGTAYFNMTHYGKFWLMTNIFWDGVETDKRTTFNDDHFGCQRAAKWFAEGVARCKNEKLAAMCCFSANLCQENKDLYEFELKYHNNYDKRPDFKAHQTPLWTDLRKRFRGARQYEDMDYWCQNLDRLVSDFK